MVTRVLLVAPSSRYVGGQSVHALRLAADLATVPGLRVRILHVDPALDGLLGRLQRVRFVRTLVTSVAYWWSLLREIPRHDVVHAYSASYWSFLLAPVPALLVGRLFGKRTILNYHSGEAPDHLARWGWHAIPLMRLAREIVVPSPWLADVFARFGLRATVVVNSLDLHAIPIRRRTAPRPAFLTNRSFQAHYNVAGVLDAFARIQARHPEASLVVAGDGPLRTALHERAAALGLRHLRFVGAVDQVAMRRLYDDADVLLNGSLIDNMPLTLIEAFAAGLPVVTSDAGGIPWMVRDGENGVLVPAGDADALAQGALALLADPARALAHADRARAEALETYTWDAVRPGWLAVYGASDPTAPATPAREVTAGAPA
jgi:glycosyltransferase involved in cell wall biosynthesis